MRYLIVQDWLNTQGNHAGMVHMCKLLCESYPNDYEVIIKPIPTDYSIRKYGIFGKLLNRFYYSLKRKKYERIVYPNQYLTLCNNLFNKLKPGDEVFLLEYLIPWVSQYELACYIRSNYPDIKIYALSHLTVKLFKEIINSKENTVEKWAKPVTKLLTLGNSLSNYFESVGIPRNLISTGFHYVDSSYYKKDTDITISEKRLNIIVMGSLQRDFKILSDVVRGCSDVNWIICKGRKKVDEYFKGLTNVDLKGYVSEAELKSLMDQADVSLNILEDTVGSNVITTSMAMGLAIIVSDVGSIRDYCNESNAIFCSDKKSIIDGISYLNNNREKLFQMRNESVRLSKRFSIENVNQWFSSLSK